MNQKHLAEFAQNYMANFEMINNDDHAEYRSPSSQTN